MRGKSIFMLGIFLALALSIGATGEEISGKTADGCSYKVINGQYMTSCTSRQPAPILAAATSHTPSSGPVTSYGDVPVRRGSGYAPSLPPQQPAPVASSAFERSESAWEGAPREPSRDKLIDQTYVGLLIGASNIKETNTGSGMGLGLSVGTNINDTFGVEIAYAYAKQNLTLGLGGRGSVLGPDDLPEPGFGGPSPVNDSSLSSHLFTAELQAHLTDPFKRLRPYLGAGLGWRSATLSENPGNDYGYGSTALSGGSLRQNTLGGLAAAGTKLRIAKSLHLNFAFRYFFPLTNQDARIEERSATYGLDRAAGTKLTRADDSLTSSSQYQILGGLQYSF